jgi:hypothetical protein
MTFDVVVKLALPEDTYKFAANGQLIPADEYVIVTGAPNAPPALPVTILFEVGNISPLNLDRLKLKVNPALLVKCGIVLE